MKRRIRRAPAQSLALDVLPTWRNAALRRRYPALRALRITHAPNEPSMPSVTTAKNARNSPLQRLLLGCEFHIREKPTGKLKSESESHQRNRQHEDKCRDIVYLRP